jgi:hypothetical protein
MRSLRRRGWKLSPSRGGGLVSVVKLVGRRCALAVCLGSAAGGRCSGERQCCSGELPRSLAGFSVLTMVVVVTPHVSKPHDYVNHMFMRP